MISFQRRNRDAKVGELRGLPVFAGLDSKRLGELARNLDEAHVPAGEILMEEGRHNDTFWIVLDGQLELTLGRRARQIVIRGGVVGLPSMFTGREASATVKALSEVRALVASHSQFNNFMADPEIEIRFKAAVFDRLRDEIYQLTTPSKTKK